MDCYPGVMPATKYGFQKNFSYTEKVAILHPALIEHLKAARCWTKELYEALYHSLGEERLLSPLPESLQSVFKTAFELDAESLLQAASVRQKWIDQSQTVDLYLNMPNMAALSSLYQRAWAYSLKTIHVLKMAPAPIDLDAEASLFTSFDEAMAGLRQGMPHYDF
jgi:ribonucleoside-diphosphate reductase alpha chain